MLAPQLNRHQYQQAAYKYQLFDRAPRQPLLRLKASYVQHQQLAPYQEDLRHSQVLPDQHRQLEIVMDNQSGLSQDPTHYRSNGKDLSFRCHSFQQCQLYVLLELQLKHLQRAVCPL